MNGIGDVPDRSGAPAHAVVVTVDEDGRPTGVMNKAAAHRGAGVRHLAFSVVIFDHEERMLLQRRTEDKATFGGHWANACCSHPFPGESIVAAAERRVREELGVALVGATEQGRFSYAAIDPATGMGENELDVVVVGRIGSDPVPDDGEIAELRWFTRAELASSDLLRAPWLDGVLEIVGW